MSAPTPIAQRQLDIGPASWFRCEPLDPAANQVSLKAGFLFQGARAIRAPNPDGDGFPQDQLSAGFSLVGTPGNQRYDLVYLDSAGAVQILAGTEVALGTDFPQGAPGWTGTNPGPAMPDAAIPVAFVLVTETGGTPAIDVTRITAINGFLRASRELAGFYVDKGLLGASPTGASDVVTALFAGETPGGSATAAGVVTTASDNLVHLLDHKRDEIIHAATGSRVYGRLTEAGGVYTLSYFYTSLLGVETAVTDLGTDSTLGAGLTNVRLVGTPKIYSVNDPARPLFSSGSVILDQVVGDVPPATTTVYGKVLTARLDADKAGQVSRVQGASGAQGDFSGIHTINFSAAIAGQVTNPSPGVVNITATGAPGPPGPNGSNGSNGSPGPPGPGFATYDGTQAGVRSGLTWNGSLQNDSFAVNFGFNPRMASCNLGQEDPTTNGVAFYITSITISGVTVTVNYSYKGSNVTNLRYCVQAAG